MDRQTERSHVRSFPALKHVAFGIACAFALAFLQGLLIRTLFASGPSPTEWASIWLVSEGVVLVVYVLIGLWIGSRAARFAWLAALFPSIVVTSALLANSAFVIGRDLGERSPYYLGLYLFFGVPSLIGGLAGHFWRLFRSRKAVVGAGGSGEDA